MGWFFGSDKPRSEAKAVKSRPTHRLAPVGTPVRCHVYELTVLTFDPHVYVGPNPPAEGKELWVGLVEVVNVDDKQAHYAPHQWRLFDGDHFAYEPISSHTCRKPQLGNSYLAPGAPVRGYITFEMPTGAVPARLSFSDYNGVAEFGVREPEHSP